MKFVKCIDIEGNQSLIALRSITRIAREDHEERASLFQIKGDDQWFECFHETIAYPKIVNCIVKL